MTNNPIEKVQQLQRRLWVCAKSSKTRRFHALYDRIHRSDVLWEAWKRVRSNKGAAGVDKTTLRSIEEQGVTQFLEGIQADLKAGQYRPSPVKRRWIPKGDGKQRPLGIPTVRDRVIQTAAKLVGPGRRTTQNLSPDKQRRRGCLWSKPIFEADFQSCSYGFRPKRSAGPEAKTRCRPYPLTSRGVCLRHWSRHWKRSARRATGATALSLMRTFRATLTTSTEAC